MPEKLIVSHTTLRLSDWLCTDAGLLLMVEMLFLPQQLSLMSCKLALMVVAVMIIYWFDYARHQPKSWLGQYLHHDNPQVAQADIRHALGALATP